MTVDPVEANRARRAGPGRCAVCKSDVPMRFYHTAQKVGPALCQQCAEWADHDGEGKCPDCGTEIEPGVRCKCPLTWRETKDGDLEGLTDAELAVERTTKGAT